MPRTFTNAPFFASRTFNSGLVPSAFYICSVPWLTSPLPLSPLSLLPTKKVAFVVKLSVTSAADTSMPALSGLLRSESFICANTMPIPPPTPLLNGRHHNHRWTYIMATNITVALCASAALIGSSLGFLPSDVSACSLRGSALWLYCARMLIPTAFA